MGGHIRMDKDLEDDPRVVELAEVYVGVAGLEEGVARNAVIGGLYRLWRYGDTYLGRHNRLKGALHGLARIAEITALPVLLLERFPREWLRVHEDGSVELPDYAAKNNMMDRDIRREKGRDRVRRFRERKKREGTNGNASHAVTGEPLQRYESVTTGPGPGPGPRPDPPRPGPGPDRTALASRRVGDAAGSAAEREQEPDRTGPPANLHDPAPRLPPSPAPVRESPVAALVAAKVSPAPKPLAAPKKTREQLERDALKLAQAGVSTVDIAHSLSQYGVTVPEVAHWLANAPPPETPEGLSP